MRQAAARTVACAPRIKLNIDQAIIDAGTERNSNHCIIAEALKAAQPTLKYIAVDIQTVRATNPVTRKRYVWITPRVLQQLIVDFDRGIKPKPLRVEFRDGQVTECGGHHAKREKSSAKKLRMARGGNKRTVPERVGGKAPPRSVGQRRAFGLRGLHF